MKYRLVLQFSGSKLEDFDRLAELEEKLIEFLGSEHAVDGHDFGSGEMNLFVHTNDPRKAFEKAKKILLSENQSEFRAAFREIKGNTYTVLWPEQYKKEFKVT